ncbi:DAK2 domain-containing protein [Acidaminobacter sp. JC074]|uniref:DAK2 domain-containing protein n=1 Tax=Acidaminobacter sp. JC074 TaxID=2530199 RepID=UPI001F110B87|nr:DAK2 domain-containing protein [Acidaminobacter sp. JC074]MCH4890269.1 DAK2 domain-containing protein [Acidaminobacter sp. JC074]
MKINEIDSSLLVKMFNQGTYALNQNKALVDALNVFPVPDGDTGTNMSLTMQSAVKNITDKEFKTVDEVSKAFAKGLLMGARGNSGVILSQIFRGFSNGCKDKEVLTTKDLIEAFTQAREVAYKAVLKPVEGTILTVIRKISTHLEELETESLEIHDLFEIILNRGNEILEKTPEYLDVLKQAGVVDAGGKGLMCILQGFNDAILGKEAKETFFDNEEHVDIERTMDPADIKFQYCTEFIVKTDIPNHTAFQAEIQTLGDSMVFVRDEDLIKVHIHTNEPNQALGYALNIGELQTIKIENMKIQHENIVHREEPVEEKEFGFITVTMGDGFETLFKDLNVDYVIKGGQTMNPSTEDITKAINAVNARQVFILPNNSNIILAANQAKELSDKDVYVVPSKTVPQGIAAMIEFSEAASAEDNLEAMTEVLSDVQTAQITYSVRDTVFNDREISEGDILGVANGDISAVGNDINEIALETVEEISEDAEILTVYYGEEVDDPMVNDLVARLEEKYPDAEIEMYNGKQPLYYYIISAE